LNFPFYIARRYLRTSSSNNAVNIISGIASVGIVVSATALFIVLSVFSGLKVFSLSFSNDFDPDLKVFPKYGKSFTISDQQAKLLKNNKDIAFYSKTIEEKVLFLYKNKEEVAIIKGVDAAYPDVNNVIKSMYQGQWLEPATAQIVMGNLISQKLSLGLFDLDNAFEIFVPKAGKGDITSVDNAFNKAALIPMGIYAINDDLDSKYVFADLQLTQDLLEFKKNQVTHIEIKLGDLQNESKTIANLQGLFKNKVIVKNRAQQNDSLYKMLNTENVAVYLIFTLVIIVALFNLVGALIMTILDKKANIKTLYNIGTPIASLRRIFLLQGTLLSVFGGCLGLFIGSVAVIIQQKYKLIMITDTLAYPVKFSGLNIIIVFLTITSLGVLASYIAANRVGKKLLE
jgi:lipoprotein-releasing system permease protein